MSDLSSRLFRRSRTRAAALLFLFLLTLLLAGCAREPSPPQAGGPVPLQVYNATNGTREILIDVLHAASRSSLFSAESTVASKRSAPIESALVPYGDYLVVAQAGQVTREARIDYRHDSVFFRFIVQDDVIGFQSG